MRTVGELLWHFPHRHADFRDVKPIAALMVGESATVVGRVRNARVAFVGRRMRSTEATIEDESGRIRALWFNQSYLAKQLPQGARVGLAGKVSAYRGRLQFESPEWEPLDEDDPLGAAPGGERGHARGALRADLSADAGAAGPDGAPAGAGGDRAVPATGGGVVAAGSAGGDGLSQRTGGDRAAALSSVAGAAGRGPGAAGVSGAAGDPAGGAASEAGAAGARRCANRAAQRRIFAELRGGAAVPADRGTDADGDADPAGPGPAGADGAAGCRGMWGRARRWWRRRRCWGRWRRGSRRC